MPDAQPRHGAPVPEEEFTLAIEEVAVLYEKAGFPRPIRRIQEYCARGDLDCRKVETISGEKYLVTPQSVERHISLIAQVQGVAGHGQTRPDTTGRPSVDAENPVVGDAAPTGVPLRPDASERALAHNEEEREKTARTHAPARPAAPSSDITIFEHPYVKRLEREVDEFKSKLEGQVRRTEQVLETANRNLIELQRANAIAQSETLAKYMLAANGKGPGTHVSTADDQERSEAA